MKKILPALIAVFLSILQPNAANSQPVIAFSDFISGLASPVDITSAGDGTPRLFIVEQPGRIRIHDGATLLATPFLDISTIISTGGERGLLSLAFHPDYENNRYFFVYYTNTSGDITVARYQTQAGDPNQADVGTGVVLISIPKPFPNHNGGDLNFGPGGYLYFGTGDGGDVGDPNNFAQAGSSLLGKMIRIDVSNFLTPPYYFIPSDNPYTGDPLVDDHIWAIGLRNPWRWSFDRATNDMWIADVGQNAWEEVNFRATGSTGGINYGWRCYEGDAEYTISGCLAPGNYVFPIFVYPHDFSTGGFSITGGFVYRAAEYPAMQGYYICADYVSGNVWLINPNGGGWTARMQAGLPGNISGFGEAENGTLYAVSLNGNVYKVDLAFMLPHHLLSFSGVKMNGYNELQWKTTAEQNVKRYIVEFSTDGIHFQYAGEVVAINQPGNQQYNLRHYTTETRKLFYRLRTEDMDGSASYSAVIAINETGGGQIKIAPTIVTDRILRISSEKLVSRISIHDSYGRLVMIKDLRSRGFFTIELPVVSRGVYWVRLETSTGTGVSRIIVD